MKKLFLSIIGIIFCAAMFAQAPNAFKYQAVARDNSGVLITDQKVSLQISILQGSASGSSVYTEEHVDTTNAYGLVNLEIGNGTTIDDFSAIDWSDGPYFVQVEMDATGGTNYALMGTNQLLSVPYALHAKNTEAWVVNGDSVYTFKNVGVGINNPLNTFEAVNSSGSIQLTNAGTTKFENNSSKVLSVVNRDNLGSTLTSLISFKRGDGTGEPAFIVGRCDNSNGIEDFGFAFPGSRVLILQNDGNVGIGTSAPNSKLSVSGGDVNILDIGSGVIMKSPDGQCWRVTIDNSGNFQSANITCP